MIPIVSATLAAGWLALVSLYFWQRRIKQVAHERTLAFAHRSAR